MTLSSAEKKKKIGHTVTSYAGGRRSDLNVDNVNGMKKKALTTKLKSRQITANKRENKSKIQKINKKKQKLWEQGKQ